MRIEALYLKQCRAFQEALFSFGKKNTAIIGPNGSGKSTLIEALYFFVSGKSFRAHRLEEMVLKGKSELVASLLFEYQGVERELSFYLSGSARQFSLDKEPVSSFSDLLGTVVAVLISPEEGELMRGQPDVRRAFLNLTLSRVDPLYLWHLQRYMRALRHRNILLKKGVSKTLDVWEEAMAVASAYITKARTELAETLHPSCSRYFNEELGGEGEIALRYKPAIINPKSSLEESFRELFASHRKRDLELGYTYGGPHRDDFTFLRNGMESKPFASEGQKQLLLTSLKLAEADFLSARLKERAIFFIDEFGLHLDNKRRNRILSLLPRLGQVIMTSTDESIPLENYILLPQ